ncbi:MAG: GNAT family N-acetyltransferase [Paracoccaceae bacterium]
MRIRRATTQDAEVCARIVCDWIARTAWMPQTFLRDDIARMIAEALPLREVYLIGEPVEGYLSLNPETGMIGALYVDRSGYGFGRALLERAKKRRDSLQLWTHEPNLEAHRFYEREGFQRVERNPKGDDGVAELRMEWHR